MSIPYIANDQYQNFRMQTEDYLREQVLQKVLIGLLVAAGLSAFISQLQLDPIFYYIAFGIEIVIVIAGFFARDERTIESLYYGFVGVTAVSLGILLGWVLQVPGGMQVISATFASTALIVGGIYSYTYIYKPQTLGMQRYLFPALLLLIGIYLVGLFVSFSSTFYLLLAFAGALLFSLYLFYDLGRLMNNQFQSPARMAWMIYWDILLIFKYMLQIMLFVLGRE